MLLYLQKIGKSLIYPIAILPFAAILNRIGALGVGFTTDGSAWNHFWFLIQAPGLAVFNNLGIIFAVGVAFGLSKDYRGEVALMGGLAFLILALLTSDKGIPLWLYKGLMPWTKGDLSGSSYSGVDVNDMIGKSKLFYVGTFEKVGSKETLVPQYILDVGVFGGIFLGILCSYMYNRWSNIKLHPYLSFFSGRRFMPFLVLSTGIPVALLFAVSWPWIQFCMLEAGTWIGKGATDSTTGAMKAGGFAGIYAVINRILQPFGLHHIINVFLWFQLPETGNNLISHSGHPETVFGDIPAFNKGIEGSGVFQSGFFPMFLGGLPATGLAMYFASKKDNRSQVFSLLFGVAAVAFLTGIDEPLVFSFIFVSPLLWIIHSLFTGILAFITVSLKIRVGFGFSAGFIDYCISQPVSWIFSGNYDSLLWQILGNPLMIIPLSGLAFAMYFPTFYFLIKKLNIATPGRQDDVGLAHLADSGGMPNLSENNATDKYEKIANAIIEAVGKDNIVSFDNCATRIRFEVKDNKNINENLIKSAGAYAVIKMSTNALQVVIGTDVESVTNILNKKLNKN